MINSIQKVPPNSEEAERCLLGCILIDSDRALPLAIEKKIEVESFYNPSHRTIYEAILALHRLGRPIQLISVADYLKDFGLLDRVGGLGQVESLINEVATVEHTGYFITQVLNKWLARKGQDVARDTISSLYVEQEPEEVLASQALSLMELADYKQTSENKNDIRDGIIDAWSRAINGGTSGIPTPWDRVNARFQGAQPGAVTAIAGRGGIGKSSVFATWCHFLGKKGKRVSWLPFEDGSRRTWARVAGIEGDFSTFELDIGNADYDLLAHAKESLDKVQTWPIFIEDRPMTVEQICAWATSQKIRNKVEILFIDAFKDIMRDKHDVESDNRVSQQLAALAKRLHIPIVVNHHVRKVDTQHNPNSTKLTGADIRGSGRIYDDARQVVAIQAWIDNGTWKYSWDIIKNNYGPTGDYELIRVSNRNKWIEPLYVPPPPRPGRQILVNDED